jgi:hypothetical protein
MAIRHRTPLIALILAPFALWALVLAWEHALLPLLSPVWRSGGVAPPSGEALRAPMLEVIAAWAAASYGMFLVYFTAGHMRIPDLWHALQVAGVLWLAVAVYAAAGWGLHYAVRR